jgi:hypothetical protein
MRRIIMKDNQFAEDLFADIGAGICHTVKLSDSNNGKFDMKKVKKYNPKTKVPEVITNALNKSKYWEDYEWKGNKRFNCDYGDIEILEYNIKTGDSCLIRIYEDNTYKDIRLNKKYINELYNSSKKIVLY